MELDNNTEALLRDFYNISNIRVSIHDTTFEEIYFYPKELAPFCKCVQKIPKIRKQCLQSDSEAFEIVKQTDKPYIYRCKCGLFEAVAPIYNYGRLTGYLMLGQVIDSDTEPLKKALETLKKQAVNQDELERATKEIVTIDMDKLRSYIGIMTVLAEHFTRTNKIREENEDLPFLIYREIVNNHSRALTLSFLSKKFGCSIATLTTLFRKEYGMSIHKFIVNTRVEQAAEMLRNSEKAIKEISEECGFYDQNHFYRTFKKVHGVSPSEYKRKHSSV